MARESEEGILDEKIAEIGPRPRGAVGGRRGLSDHQVKMAFLTPTLVLLIAWNIFPLLWSLYLSFCNYSATASQPARWVGAANYHAILNDPTIWKYFSTTATIVLFSVLAQAIIGFSLAMLLNRAIPCKGLIVTLLLLPMMLSPAIMAKFWSYILEPNFGVLGALLEGMGMDRILWFSSPGAALTALVLVDVWQWTPFVMLISLAGLSAIPKHLYEAAQMDRASRAFQFMRITVPLVAPLVIMALIFRTMDAFKVFDLIVLTDGAPSDQTLSISRHIARETLTQNRTGYGSAMGYLVLVFVIGLSNLYLKYLDKIQGKRA